MKNLTLRIEETVLSKARQIAAGRETSVNGLIREYLDDLIRQQSSQESARRELVSLCHQSKAEIGNRNWTRDELYER